MVYTAARNFPQNPFQRDQRATSSGSLKPSMCITAAALLGKNRAEPDITRGESDLARVQPQVGANIH